MITAAQAQNAIRAKTAKIMGFGRKALPQLEAMRRVDRYIYNVSDERFIHRNPGFPQFVIEACAKNQDYSAPLSVMEMYAEEYLGSGDTTEFNWYTGEEIANDILQFGPGLPASIDLHKRGLFVSKTNPPAASEVAEAKHQLRLTMDKLLREGDIAQAAGNLKDINEEHRRAAAFLGQPRDWSREHVAMITCPGCGQPVSENAAVHFGPGACGAILNRDKAIELGLAKSEAKEESHLDLKVRK